jgi:hypothetical protein
VHIPSTAEEELVVMGYSPWFKSITYELHSYELADGAPQLTHAKFISAVCDSDSTVDKEQSYLPVV